MKRLLMLLAGAGLVAASSAQAQDAPYKLSGQWAADYGDDYCRLAGTFSNGKDEIAFGFERTQPGPFLRMMLSGKDIRTFRGATELGYQFRPGGSAQSAPYFRSKTPDGQDYIFLDNLSLLQVSSGPAAPGAEPAPPQMYNRQAEQDAAGGVTGVVLDKGMTSPVHIDTGSLRAPLSVLQDCADDLLKVWELDPEKHKTMTMPVIPNFSPEGWLPGGMIPFSEFSKFMGNSNQVRLIVDAAGKPSSCTVHRPTLSQSLNGQICSTLMEKASFEPAKDAQGQPMASYWMGSPMFLGPPMGGRR